MCLGVCLLNMKHICCCDNTTWVEVLQACCGLSKGLFFPVIMYRYVIVQRDMTEHAVLLDGQEYVPGTLSSAREKHYAHFTDPCSGKLRSLARRIMLDPYKLQVDHINGNTLDNRRCNLRIVTPQQNCWNRPTRSDSYTSIRNVEPMKNGKFRARGHANGKQCSLGCYHTVKAASEAVLAHDRAHSKCAFLRG